ncbi:MAG TPA: DUF4271 domain-containing protein [Saprospiraceae bacterium]|nr:DUF4271 domain-containing protein [Saprospiraceae bacterium]
MHLLKFFIISIIIFSGCHLFAQANNPFEVRLKRSNIESPATEIKEKKEIATENVLTKESIITEKITEPEKVDEQDVVSAGKVEELNVNLEINPFEVDRRRRVRSIVPENIEGHKNIPLEKVKELSEEEKSDLPVDAEKPKEVQKREGAETAKTIEIPKDRKDLPAQSVLSFIVLMLSMILLAVVANVRRSIFGKVVKSIFNDNILKATQKEEDNGKSGAMIILYIIFLLNLSTFIYLFVNWFYPHTSLSWWLIFGGITIIYLIRHLFLTLFSNIFQDNMASVHYSFMIAVFNLLIGIFLFPANLIIAFAPDKISFTTLIISMVILGLIYLIRYTRGIIQGLLLFSHSLFHFFLYLCTFEVIPLLVIVRVALDTINS